MAYPAAIAMHANFGARDLNQQDSRIHLLTAISMYAIKEMFYTIQGEGVHTGRPAVFCRFAGCNLWSGLEKDRESAICNFCDTDFVGTDGDLSLIHI